MNRILLALSLVIGLPACGTSEEGEPAGVSIVAPLEGAELTGPDVSVRLEASGVTITSADIHEPGTGHHHLFVDRDLTPLGDTRSRRRPGLTPLGDTIPAGVPGIIHLGRGQIEFLVEGLEPGEHRVIAIIAEWTHVPLNPPAVDTVRFTVVPPS